MDLYIIEHEEQHTEECLKYAGKFGKRYCIAQCLDARRKAAEQHMHADGACPKCGAEGYVILGDGRKYCNICKTPRP